MTPHPFDNDFRVTREQQERFAHDGFLKLEGFLNDSAVAMLRERADIELNRGTVVNFRAVAFSKSVYDFNAPGQGLFELMERPYFQEALAALTGHDLFLTFEASFEIEKNVSKGAPWHVGFQSFGYQFAEENKIPDQPIGAIPLDTNYSPVLKVHYEIENARVGRRTDYDKLIMEVWTDGSVHPEDAMSQAAQILTEHLSLFINFTEEPEGTEEKEVDEEAKKIAQLLQTPVEEIELTVRSANCLKAAGITHLRDLVSRTEAEMLQYRNFGRKSLNELQKILEENNLSWGMDLTPYDGIEVAQTADNPLAEEF